MTVADMESRMSNVEYLHWAAYFMRKSQREELAALKARRG